MTEKTVDRWERAKRLFVAALDEQSSRRSKFLADACRTDDGLRRDVESMLAFHEEAEAAGFLDSPAAADARQEIDGVAPTAFPRPDGGHDETRPHRRSSRSYRLDSSPAVDTFDDYELVEVLGQGGMGVVYKARQISLNRTVALKMIRSGSFSSQQEIDRFHVEAEAAARLDHPGIVPVYEVGQSGGRHFYSMGYVEGESLAGQIKSSEEPCSPRVAAELVSQVAVAVHYAHEHGVVHRDLKPANVLLDENGNAKITDFGLAKQMDFDSQLTATGQVMGTPSYMPPEQAQGANHEIGPPADVYALGATLYMLMTGRPPFGAANFAETIRQVIHDEPISPRLLNSSLPRDLEIICLKCLNKDRAKRYASAQDLADELRRFLQGRPILAQPVSSLEKGVRWCRRNPIVAVLLGTVALSVMTIAVVSTTAYFRTAAALRESNDSFRTTIGAVDALFTKVSENRLLNRPGMQRLREELLATARDYYRQLVQDARGTPELQEELGRAYFRLGAINHQLITPDDAEVSSYQSALEALHQALTIQQALKDEVDAADQRYEPRVLALSDTWTELGTILLNQADPDEAHAAFQRALGLRQEIAGNSRDDADARRKLANAHMNLGVAKRELGASAAEVHAEFTSAQTIRRLLIENGHREFEVVRDYAKGCYNQSVLPSIDGTGQDTEDYLLSAVESFNEALRLESDDLQTKKSLAFCYQAVAGLYANSLEEQGPLDPKLHKLASEYYRKAHDQLQSLAQDNHDDASFAFHLARVEIDHGELERLFDQFDSAKQQLASVRQRLDLLLDEGLAEVFFHYTLASQTLADMAPVPEADRLLRESAERLAGLDNLDAQSEADRDHYVDHLQIVLASLHDGGE